MKKGKTLFSYILWFIATGFSVFFTYYATSKMASFYELYGSNKIICRIEYTAIVILLTVAVFFLFRFIYGKFSGFFCAVRIPKWLRIILHILIFAGITVILVRSRIYSFASPNQDIEYGAMQEMYFSYMSEIPAQKDSFFQDYLEERYSGFSLIPSAFENIFMGFVSFIYFFIGNQIEFFVWMPFYMPLIAYALLILIGFKLQKGFFVWIPALVYSVSGIYSAASVDWGPANFYFLLTLFGVALILLLTKRKNQKDISVVIGSLWGLLICLFVFYSKFNVIFFYAPVFNIPKKLGLSMTALNIELLIWAVFLLMICLSFWFSGRFEGVFYIIPAVAGTGLMIALYQYECDVVLFLLSFVGIWLTFMGTEHIRGLEHSPQPVYTDLLQSDTVLPESSDVLADDDTQKEEAAEAGVIRVFDIIKDAESEHVQENDKDMAETPDRTAMIENVLPMPKKHVSRELNYSMEPDADMMHYDIEPENDDYDYK